MIQLVSCCSLLAVVGRIFSERECWGPPRCSLPKPITPRWVFSGTILCQDTSRGSAQFGEAGGGSSSGAIANSSIPGKPKTDRKVLSYIVVSPKNHASGAYADWWYLGATSSVQVLCSLRLWHFSPAPRIFWISVLSCVVSPNII